MYRIYQTFVDSLAETADVTALQANMAETIRALNLSCFAYLRMSDQKGGAPQVTYPEAWTAYYLKNHCERLDPVITQALRDLEPFEWGHNIKTMVVSDTQRELFQDPAEFGICCGFTVPIHDGRGPIAAITFAADERDTAAFSERVKEHGRVLQLMAMYFHAHARRKLVPERQVDGVSLSPREFQCLVWSAQGKSAWEIGCILGISHPTAAVPPRRRQGKTGRPFDLPCGRASGRIKIYNEKSNRLDHPVHLHRMYLGSNSRPMPNIQRSRRRSANYYGQFVKNLAEMQRLRYRVFKERLDWDVQISGDIEVDEFDALQPAYLIQRASDGRVQGCVRLLPSIGPTMLREIFPILLDGALAPASPAIRASSRFPLDLHPGMPKTTHGLATTTCELFAGMIEFGLSRELTEIVTVTDARMERILGRAGWPLRRIGRPCALGSIACGHRISRNLSRELGACPQRRRDSRPVLWAPLAAA